MHKDEREKFLEYLQTTHASKLVESTLLQDFDREIMMKKPLNLGEEGLVIQDLFCYNFSHEKPPKVFYYFV